MATTLEGSTALVTGATSGIGRAIAQQLAALGAEVVVHGRSPERGAETVRAIENEGGKARFVAADLSKADEVRRLAEEAGPVDILINNAGVYRFGATADTDDAFFDEHVNLNLRAPYILVQKLVPGMAERGHGAVVNISTLAASTPARQAGIYGATKAGVELLTRVWADEFGPLRRAGEHGGGRADRDAGHRRHAGAHRRARHHHDAGPRRRSRRNRPRGNVSGVSGRQLHQRCHPARHRRSARHRAVVLAIVGAVERGDEVSDIASARAGQPHRPRPAY